MKLILAVAVALGVLLFSSTVGCTRLSQSQENSQETTYTYGDQLRVKSGFYKGFGCTLIYEYSDSVFCTVSVTPDGRQVAKEWETNQNFEKSNVELLPETK